MLTLRAIIKTKEELRSFEVEALLRDVNCKQVMLFSYVNLGYKIKPQKDAGNTITLYVTADVVKLNMKQNKMFQNDYERKQRTGGGTAGKESSDRIV